MDGRSKAPVKFMYQPQEALLVHYDVPVHSRGEGYSTVAVVGFVVCGLCWCNHSSKCSRTSTTDLPGAAGGIDYFW